jgi:hypothetical protein
VVAIKEIKINNKTMNRNKLQNIITRQVKEIITSIKMMMTAHKKNIRIKDRIRIQLFQEKV